MRFMLPTNGSEEWFQLLYFSKAGLTRRNSGVQSVV